MKLNGIKYSENTLVKNILRVYDATNEHQRYDWYSEAHNFAIELSKSSGYSVAQCCGVIAAFSPLKRWNENKKIARAFLDHGIVDGLHTRVFIGKAKSIIHYMESDGCELTYISQVLRGEKIKAFFHNILKPACTENVTIDRHAICIAIGRKYGEIKINNSQYRQIKAAYIKAANKLQISPIKLQSATWLIWRANGQTQLL